MTLIDTNIIVHPECDGQGAQTVAGATVCGGLYIFQQRVTFFARRVTFFIHGVTLEQIFVGPTHGVKIELHAVI